MKLTDIPESERLEIQRAIFADMTAANNDPMHPGWHFTPPAHFMLDVWGAIYLDRWYHIFYSTCRKPGGMSEETVFGHARSRDLIHFEHLPLPICPAQEEVRMNDGCICLNGEGLPVMLYTSVPKQNMPRTHHAAVGTRDLLSFQREPEPFLTLENHGGPTFKGGWSDPFVFEAFGRRFMLMSKCVDRERNRLPIYEATDDSCTRWEYRGIMLEDNGEVVNFFPVGDRWMLIFSPYDSIRYFVGTFDEQTLTFTPEKEGILCHGYVKQNTDRGFYATCVFREADRNILCGWMSGFEGTYWWNGCMATPREISVNNRLQATMLPIREILQLRRDEISFAGTFGEVNVSAQADIEVEFSGALTLEFVGSVKISVTSNGFAVGNCEYPGTLPAADSHHLRILLDRSFIELYFDDGSVSAARPVKYAGDSLLLKIDGDVKIHAWRMESVKTKTV